jgi:hypothetical protein
MFPIRRSSRRRPLILGCAAFGKHARLNWLVINPGERSDAKISSEWLAPNRRIDEGLAVCGRPMNVSQNAINVHIDSDVAACEGFKNLDKDCPVHPRLIGWLPLAHADASAL